MNKIIFMVPLLVFGCETEDSAYDGGAILYEEAESLPDPPEDIQQCEDASTPFAWTPTVCVANKTGECCYWMEQTSTGESFRGEPIVTSCRHDWCWDKYQCEWLHVITSCDG